MMHEFERALSRSIPLGVSAGFFHRIKTAGWGEPPDETGALEGAFAAPIEQVIAKLTEVAAAKFQLMVAYHVYAESMRGVAQHACAEVFHEHAEQERAAGEAYLKRTAVLGSGPVHLPEVTTPPASADPAGILMLLARAEQEAIAAQRELKALVGEDNPLSFQIEQFMVEDQHHLDECWQMLPQDAVRTPVIDTAPAGMVEAPNVEEETPAPVEAPAVPKSPSKTAGALANIEKTVFDGKRLGAKPFQSFNAFGTPSKEVLMALPAGGAAVGAGLGSLRSLVQSPEDKEQVLETGGPVSQFKTRHPVIAGALGGAALGGSAALAAKGLMRGRSPLDPTGGVKPASVPHLVGGAGLFAAPSAVGIVDEALARKRDEALAKSASIAELGRKMRRGLGRYGELVSGSNARRMGRAAQNAMLDAQRVAGRGVDQAARRGKHHVRTHGEEIVGEFKRRMGKATELGDAAVKEYDLSRKVQIGTGAGAVGALGTAAAAKNRSDMKKIERTNQRLKTAFVVALEKLALAPSEPGFGSDPSAAPMPGNEPSFVPQPSMEAPGPQPPMAQPPGTGQYAPVNYLEAELTGRRVQEANEANFYRAKADEASTQVASMGEQVQSIQGQLDQLSAQAAESQSQIMAANEEAMRANDQMLNQATLAARMRMGMQQLRAQMMEVASQDPEQLAAAAGGPTPMDVGQQAQMAGAPAAAPAGSPEGASDPTGGAGGAPPGAPAEPGADPGTPAASPDPGAPPGSPSAGAGGPPGGGGGEGGESQKSDGGESTDKKKDTAETTVSIKKGSAKTAGLMNMPNMEQELRHMAPYVAAGVGLGGLAGAYEGYHEGDKVPNLQKRVSELQGTFGKSLELAQTQVELAKAEEARANPGKSALRGGLRGAAIGMTAGAITPQAIGGVRELGKHIKHLRAN
jgi:outer membrane murein-binding lipoprotein Lpp